MNTFSRRDFLKTFLALLGASTLEQFLAACNRNPSTPSQSVVATPMSETQPAVPTSTNAPQTTEPIFTPQAKATIRQTPPASHSPTPAPTQVKKEGSGPDLVVARGGEPEEMVRRALQALGGMQRFVPKGSNVVIKPNICVAYHSFEYAATTNPWVVGALVKLCLEAGARSVQVMDYPFGGSAKEAYARSGIEEQVKAAGGEMTVMPSFRFVQTDIPKGVALKKCDIFDDILKADVVIDVPIAKHHSLARLTLGMKNLMGVIRDRPAMHANLGQRLADLTSRIPPTLTVVDAVRILVNHGPTGGNLDDVKKLDTIIVSPDIVAADSYATTLFGLKPEDIAYITAAAKMKLGRSDLNQLRIEEINVGA